MQGLKRIAECYHTKLITTSDRAKIEGVSMLISILEDGIDTAKRILKLAVENYKQRKGAVFVPDRKEDMIAGFSYERSIIFWGASSGPVYALLTIILPMGGSAVWRVW
jgi:carbon-monoxide dehydrogenase catalytic subunit